jgi:multidrug efflux pump subunit AcrA (membrane-fusion protein)
VCLAVLAAACGCSPGEAEPVAASTVSAGWVDRGPFQRELLLTGELEAVRSVSIKSPQTRIFQMSIQFMAEEGTVVREGDPLLDFDNSALADQVRDLETRILDAETQIVAKRAELASALKDLEIEVAEKEYEEGRTRVEAEIDPSVVSREDYSERQLAHRKAARELAETHDRVRLTRDRGQAELDVLIIDRDKLRADLRAAQDGLDLLSIKAPAEGLVVYERRPQTTLRFQEGDSCWPGQAVLRLPDLSEMQVVFHVNEVDAPLLEVGMPVRITVDAFPGRELSGTIEQIPSMAVKRDEDSRVAVFNVVASLSETWVGEMKPGMSSLGRVVVERREDVPRVPRRLVRFDGTDYWVVPPVEDLAPRRIEPLARNARHYRISEDDYAALTGAAPAAPDPEGERDPEESS